MNFSTKPKLLIITGASGSGKSTLSAKILEKYPNKYQSHKSYTTRSVRHPDDYSSYHFVSVDEFLDKVKNNEFIEIEEVYDDCFYGTPKSGLLVGDKIKILVKDVKGAKFLKRLYGKEAMLVYLQASNLEELNNRITSRTNEPLTEEKIARNFYENSRDNLNEDLIIDTTTESIDRSITRINSICTLE